MRHEEITLPGDPAAAVAACREQSRDVPVVVFKQSPRCPVSHHARAEFHVWLDGRGADAALVRVVEIDVIAEKSLARGLAAELDIQHESPQALLFHDGEIQWHASHAALTRDRFEAELARALER
jgi:bacillithiol system protein YtxJ